MSFRYILLMSALSLVASSYAGSDYPVMDQETTVLLNKVQGATWPTVDKIPLALLRSPSKFYGYQGNRTVQVRDIAIPGSVGEIPLRIYTPAGAQETQLPVFVMFHGGGWIMGDLETHDGLCREISQQADCIVVSVAYHRAPEYKFPVPFNDCYDATAWVVKEIASYGGNPSMIAVGGDSAGGNLAAAVALKARDTRDFALAAEVLLYPVTNNNFATDSYVAFGSNGYYLLPTKSMQFFWDSYSDAAKDNLDYYAKPLIAPSHQGLPPTFMVVADFDPLRDDGLAYADQLEQDNVIVELKQYPTIHGFLSFKRYPGMDDFSDSINRLTISAQATADIATYLRSIFSR
ncbi:alpha/beta hydrolase [Candidatus Dependentiae bacterium]|nr:alpha/beta hydrolase [Candidatus Dependentiae bacterium]